MKDRHDLARRLNSATVHLGRALRGLGTGLPAEHQSVLTAVVFGGPTAIGALARREGVGAPAMTKTVGILAREGLVRRGADPEDGRVVRVEATPTGRRMVLRGRNARVQRIVHGLATLAPADRQALGSAIEALESLVRDLEHPSGGEVGTLRRRGRTRPLSR